MRDGDDFIDVDEVFRRLTEPDDSDWSRYLAQYLNELDDVNVSFEYNEEPKPKVLYRDGNVIYGNFGSNK